MKKYKLKSAIFLTSIVLGAFMLAPMGPIHAQENKKEGEIPLRHGAHREGKRTDAAMEHWRDYGFGQFIHWGLYSILGGDYKNKHYSGASEWIRSWDQLPNEEYDRLNEKFDPTEFNPEKWAKMAKDMGVKYMTLTTKHHDGFCLWPSKYTDYTVADSPYKKDIVGPLVEAYTKEGIDVYLYFSIMDWHNPDWRYDLKTKEDTIAFDRFKKFTQNQLTELLENYPETKGFWFDGTWDKSWKKNGAFSDSLEQHLKSIKPDLIIGSRLRADEKGARHFDSNGRLMGDYEQGWERKLPKSYEEVKDNDWEAVMTIPKNGWGYSKKWMGHWKTPQEILELLAKSVSMGGNFVLNFGPKGDGTFREKEVQLSKVLGSWMDVNSSAIYNTRYAGWEKQDWGYYTKTKNSDTVNMIVFNISISKALRVGPAKNILIEKASFLNKDINMPLKIEALDSGEFFIHLPEGYNAVEPFVIELKTGPVKTKSKEIKMKT